MKTRAEKKREKEREQEYQMKKEIAGVLAAIKESRGQLENALPKFDLQIDKAAELGQDEYSNELIQDKVETQDIIRILEFFETEIMNYAVTSSALSALKPMQDAIAACSSLLNAGPDFKKLGNQMAEFRKKLETARGRIKELHKQLRGKKDADVEALFGPSTIHNAEFSAKVKAEKEARDQRLRMKLDSTPKANMKLDESDAGIDDITRMIDEENKKK